MRMFRWPSLLSLSAVLFLISPVAQAAIKLNKLLIYPAPGETIDQLKQSGIQKVKNYGAYWLVEADDQQAVALKASHGDRAQKANYLDVVELGALPLVTTDAAPAIPGGLQDQPTTGKHLRLIQFAGPVLPEWLAQVKATGHVQVINYIPNNAYLIRLDAAAEAKLQALKEPQGPIQYIGAYHPYYKLSQSLTKTQSGTINVNVLAVADDDANQTLAQIRELALRETQPASVVGGRLILHLTVTPAALNQIAALPAVTWIEPAIRFTRQDEKSTLITSTFTNGPGHGPVVGTDDYLSFLTNTLGFPNSPIQYPILDIADSGVDELHPTAAMAASLYTVHPDFWEIQQVDNMVEVAGAVFDEPTAACLLNPTCNTYSFHLKPSRVTYHDADDTDGHGTLVASAAIGAGVPYPLEEINRRLVQTTIDCITNIIQCGFENVSNVNVFVCYTNNPPVGIIPGFTSLTNLVCTTNCVTVVNGDEPTNSPTAIAKGSLGARYGLGVNPFGRFGASLGGADDPAFDPFVHARRIYLGQYGLLPGRARISNNSWGEILVVGGNDGVYDTLSQAYDLLTRDAVQTGATNTPGPSRINQELIYVFAGGNANGVGAVSGFGDVLVTPPATAKNIITVGASENVRPGVGDRCVPFAEDSDNSYDISFFNSFGPTSDGRFKPDVVAPGASIRGANSQATYTPKEYNGPFLNSPNDPCSTNAVLVPLLDQFYTCGSGTSFSAPQVAGAVQLLWWWVVNRLDGQSGMARNLPPSAALARAYILNSARYLATDNPLYPGVLDTLPSTAQGMGELDLAKMFDGMPRVVRDESTPRAFDSGLVTSNPVPQQTYFSKTGQSYEMTGTIASNGLPFRVTLAWTDAAGDPGSFVQLVNNLDLAVTVGGKLYKGNVFVQDHSVTGGNFDGVNNAQSVFLRAGDPTVVAGTPFKVVVRAFNIAGDGVPNVGNETDQDFALIVYNASAPADVPNPATNDACQTAWDLTTFPVSITNTLNKTIYHNVHPSPAAAAGGVEEFFKVETPTPGTVFNITTAGSSFNTVLSVWRVQTVPQGVFVAGKCGALVEVVSTNIAGNGQSALSFVADGSNTYYIVVEPFNNGNGGQLVLNANASAPLIAASPALLNFGEMIAGLTSASQAVTYSNNSTVVVYVSDVRIGGTDAGDFVIDADGCNGNSIAPGGYCTIRVAFAPTTSGAKSAQLEITDDATGSPRIVSLLGTGLEPVPVICLGTTGPLVFSNQAVSTSSAAQTITLTNCGTAALNVTNITFTGSGSNDFSVAGETCTGAPIASSGTCTIPVVFTPLANGVRQATLNIFHDAAGSPSQVTVHGTGFTPAPAVCLNRTSLTFSNLAVDTTSAPQSVTISNCGTASLTISNPPAINGANAGDFAIVGNTCSTLATGQTCQITLTFTPTASGLRTAQLAITNSATGSPHLVALSGGGLVSQPDGLIGKNFSLARRKNGQLKSFLGENIITNVLIQAQTYQTKIKRGARSGAKLYLTTINAGTQAEQFNVLGDAGSGGWSARYYLGAQSTVDVTDAVTNGTFATSTLGGQAIQGAATMLRMELFASTNVVRGTSNTFFITYSSASNPAKQDVVAAQVIAK